MSGHDEMRRQMREFNRQRRATMTDRELVLEALERLDTLAVMFDAAQRKLQEVSRTADDAARTSSTALRAVSGPSCSHASERPPTLRGSCPCPPGCYCRAISCAPRG